MRKLVLTLILFLFMGSLSSLSPEASAATSQYKIPEAGLLRGVTATEHGSVYSGSSTNGLISSGDYDYLSDTLTQSWEFTKLKVIDGYFLVNNANSGDMKIIQMDLYNEKGEVIATLDSTNNAYTSTKYDVSSYVDITPVYGVKKVKVHTTKAGTYQLMELDLRGSDDTSTQPDPGTTTPDPGTTTPDPGSSTETGDRALLTVTLINGIEKEYDLSISEVTSFLNWFDGRDTGVGPLKFGINKGTNNKGPFKKRIEYLIFDRILTFEVNEYSLKNN
ncbi:hypothetical protein [Paenibacillus amylolyticus]|uniref:hypothetical protein n=1 Tax=Paenibacillus amylolyticus TaxID=1451 RepID=UPI00249B9521|nr:hypothetical protein [Paenibacillus amylolyticus]WFA86494.1 hypothetical protein OGI70_06080 [Paenibacillus amylolyticus]